MKSKTGRLLRIAGVALFAAFVAAGSMRAQTPMGPAPTLGSTPPAPVAAAPKQDSAIIFEPSHPLIKTPMQAAREYPNLWGFSASFSDYGFGGGLFLGHSFGQDVTAELSAEIGTAQGSREFDLITVNKINRVFVVPIMASLQYRLFREGLSENLRPYLTAGAGPVIAMTTPYAEDFFTAFVDGQSKVVPGGFIGLGAKFGTDPRSTFGASLRYFIIPYPGGIQSTTSESLPDLSGLFLTVSFGMNF